MGHPHRMREIAQQAGLSLATVDRVLNHRAGVRPSTVAEVRQAILDLDRQRSQLRLGGRTFVLDLVMQAPERFSAAVRTALEAEQPLLRPAVVRSRFHFDEESDAGTVVKVLEGIAAGRSHGVLLKAPDTPAVADAVARLVEGGVPVVTVFTDGPLSRRLAYVGIDNRSAGATAAYLITQWSPGGGTVLVTVSSSTFRGEDEREMGFRSAMRSLAPGRSVRDVTETNGLEAAMGEAVTMALEADPTIDAVYSVGGGNQATLTAFEQAGRRCTTFIAHDLDRDNTRLLRQRRIAAVLHHDLRDDVRRACRLVLQAHGVVPGTPYSLPSQIQGVTPYNEPSGLSERHG